MRALNRIVGVGWARVLKNVSSVMKASTDCEGIVKFGVLIAPPPYVKVAALMTAIAPLWMPTLPHAAGTSLAADSAAVSPVTLIGFGTSVVTRHCHRRGK